MATVTIKTIFKTIAHYFFPTFYNKLTWTTVVAGLALLSSSICNDLVRALLGKYLNIDISNAHLEKYGFGLVALGLLYNVGYKLAENFKPLSPAEITKIREDLEHDKTIFQKIELILNGKNLTAFLNRLLTAHSYLTDSSDPIHRFEFEGMNVELEFINPDLNTSKSEYHKSLCRLMNFVGVNFFDHGPQRNDGQLYMCLKPEWNIDRGGRGDPTEMRKYDELSKELLALVNEVQRKYEEFRVLSKKLLAI